MEPPDEDAPFGSFRLTDDTDRADSYLRLLEPARSSDGVTSS